MAQRDGFDPTAYQSNLILEKTEVPANRGQPFQLGQAMVSQKKIAKHDSDLQRVKETMAELQIYVQKHNVQINTTLVDEIKLKVVMETLRNEMEARFDATFARFEMAQNNRVANLVSTENVQKMLAEKVQKRVYEVTISQLEQNFTALEARVTNSLPAMQYEIKNGLKSKVAKDDMKAMLKDKAGYGLVETLVKRFNNLQMLVEKGGGRGGGGDDSGSDISERSGNPSQIDEDEEDQDEISEKPTPPPEKKKPAPVEIPKTDPTPVKVEESPAPQKTQEALGRRQTVDESKIGKVPNIEEVEGFSEHDSSEADHDITMKPDKGFVETAEDFKESPAPVQRLQPETSSKSLRGIQREGSSRNIHQGNGGGGSGIGVDSGAFGDFKSQMDIKISDVDEAMECLRHKNTQLEEDINKLKAELKKMPVFIQDQIKNLKPAAGPTAGASPTAGRAAMQAAMAGGTRVKTPEPDHDFNASQARLLHKIEDRMNGIGIDLERKMVIRSQEMIETSKKDIKNTIENRVASIDAEMQGYYKRFLSLDIKANNACLEVQNNNEQFSKKCEQITDRWMTAMGKEEKVRFQLKSFGDQLNSQSEVLYGTKASTEKNMSEMRTLLNNEMKDLRAANQAYAIELERNQKLFRELQTETLATLDERKAQNENLLEQTRDMANNKKSKRRNSISVTGGGQPSVASLLPQLKTQTEQSNAKLTARQMRVSSIIRGERMSLGLESQSHLPSMTLAGDASVVQLRTNIEQTASGIRSTKAFITSPGQNSRSSIIQEKCSIPEGYRDNKPKKPVFNGEAYKKRNANLEKQEKMSQASASKEHGGVSGNLNKDIQN